MEKLNKIEMMARDLMAYHGLENWIFKFSNAVNQFGHCSFKRKTIKISKPLTLLNDEAEVLNTILHEIAHGLRPFEHHNNIWQITAKNIGCTGTRCYDSTKVATPAEKYIGTCPKCHRVIKRFRRRKISCSRCDSNFNSALLFVWSEL